MYGQPQVVENADYKNLVCQHKRHVKLNIGTAFILNHTDPFPASGRKMTL